MLCLDLPENPPDLGTLVSIYRSHYQSLITCITARFQTLASKTSTQFSYHSINVTNASQVSAVLDVAISKLRHPLRGVVTCAGISGEVDAVDYIVEDFRRLLDVNIVGTFLIVQAASRVILSQGLGGSVVLIASMSGSVANKVSTPFLSLGLFSHCYLS